MKKPFVAKIFVAVAFPKEDVPEISVEKVATVAPKLLVKKLVDVLLSAIIFLV